MIHKKKGKSDMRIWAHRGCSQRYPDNTLLSFKKTIILKN